MRRRQSLESNQESSAKYAEFIQKYGHSTNHPSDGSKSALHNYTTEELFRMRDELEKTQKEGSQVYATRLRKRSPKAYTSNTEFLSPVIKQKDRYREFFRTSRPKLL
jgi:hypothetical protein